MILLDTPAVVWIALGHRRARPLERFARLYLSPASLLEIQFLVEVGRLRLTSGCSIVSLAGDERWRLDEPPSARWFETASELSWTRDPFDRLLVAHARLRGWRLATADDTILANLPPSDVLSL